MKYQSKLKTMQEFSFVSILQIAELLDLMNFTKLFKVLNFFFILQPKVY